LSTFSVGDRVQLRELVGSSRLEPVGTVAGFLTPPFAAKVSAPDDVVVRWDSGLELPHAPATLTHARSAADERVRTDAKSSRATR
jgi:hypothetical protein